MGKITLINIAEELAVKSGQSKEVADKFLHAIVETIEKGLVDDKVVKIKGLGTFKLLDVSDRDSIDVNTGERITIKGYTKVSFTPDSSMKEFINRPFAHFEPTELNEGYPEEDVVIEKEEPMAAVPEVAPAEEKPVAEEPVVEESTIETAVPADMKSEEVVGDMPIEKEAVLVNDTESVEATEAPDTIEPAETAESIEEAVSDEVAETIESTESTEECVDVPSEASILPDTASEVGEQTVTATEEVHQTECDVVENHIEKPIEPTGDVAEKKGKKRSGCLGWGIGCLVMLLLLAVAVVAILAYFSTSPKISDFDLFEEDKIEVSEQGEIKVNPNLDKELGIERHKEPATPNVAPDTVAESITEAEPEKVAVPTKEVVAAHAEETKPVQPAPEATKPATMPTANTLVITESLAAKSIKDITIADTTDYSINGTQATHTLQSGETIIQLARKYYGDKRLWPYIVKYNNITDFNKVAIGMTINIPVLKNKDAVE